MATSTTNLSLTKNVVTDGIQATIVALAANFQIIDDELVQLADIQAMYDILETAISNHEDSTTAHMAEDLRYEGLIPTVVDIKAALDALHTRIENIVFETDIDPNKDAEVVDARHSAYKSNTFDNLNERLDAIETDPHYKWIEEHDVLTGNNTIVFTSPYHDGDELIIMDKTYQVQWFAPENYTVTGQTLTFTSNMVEDLTFRIINLG